MEMIVTEVFLVASKFVMVMLLFAVLFSPRVSFVIVIVMEMIDSGMAL